MRKTVKLLALTLAITIAVGANVIAVANLETITAFLNTRVHINFDGVEQTLKDADGETVYPLTYNGTTYLPVRAVAGLVGLPVDYDATTDTVLLGKTSKSGTSFDLTKSVYTEDSKLKANSYSYFINDNDGLTVIGDSGKITYSAGIGYNIWNGFASSGHGELFFETKGADVLEFTAVSSVSCELYIRDGQRAVISVIKIEKNVPKVVNVNISSVTHVMFDANASDKDKYNNGEVRILEPKASYK